MFKPRFEDPIDSAKQLIENNITLFMVPGTYYWVQFFANSPVPEYQTLSKRLIIAEDWIEFDHLIEHGVIGNGTHAKMSYSLEPREKSLGRWWKGNLVMGYPYTGYPGTFQTKSGNLTRHLIYSVSFLLRKIHEI